jgi:hypothetical protein
MKIATAWLVAIVGGFIAILIVGKLGVIVLVLGLIYALMRTIFG